MTLKSTVSVKKLQSQTLLAMIVANEVYRSIGADLTITSVCDSHDNSPTPTLHPTGFAFDCRTRDLRSVDIPTILAGIRSKLTLEYDVVDETGNTVKGPHIHIEFDPKK